MKVFDLPFKEQKVNLMAPDSRAELKRLSPSGLVPCLDHEGFWVWDSLAIADYLAEQHPEKSLWPKDQQARARARSLAAEMHAGFSSIRTVWPMDLSVSGAGLVTPKAVRHDLGRLFSLWQEARATYGSDGGFLFGDFCIADAFFAPVAFRLRTYGPVEMPPVIAAYLETLLSLPALAEWEEGAREEIDAGWYR